METVTLDAFFHRNSERIGIHFDKNFSLEKIIRLQPGAKWSRTFRCWYIPLHKESHRLLLAVLKGKAQIEQSALHHYLVEKQNTGTGIEKLNVPVMPPVQITPAPLPSRGAVRTNSFLKNAGKIHPVNAHVLQALQQQLKLKAYSVSTIRTYINEMAQLLGMLKDIPADELTPEVMRRYLLYCYEKLKLSENTLHSRINAMKFYYEQVLYRERFFWEIPRPKKRMQLPKLLNETEIRRLFNALSNKKHKAMLFTAYSAGLRVSEIANIKIADIDSGRMQIFIEKAKGKKDRYVNLSPILLDILRSYIENNKPRPVQYLFESETPGQGYAIRTVQQIFTNAKNKAGIKKDVGIHSLRHSFATHLLDKGTDIKYIKDILGHFSIKTTERYLHVSRRELVNIISPFDDLWGNEKIDW
jgi:integrase/recombinase XerD